MISEHINLIYPNNIMLTQDYEINRISKKEEKSDSDINDDWHFSK